MGVNNAARTALGPIIPVEEPAPARPPPHSSPAWGEDAKRHFKRLR